MNQSILLLLRLSELCFVNGDIHVILLSSEFFHVPQIVLALCVGGS